MPISHKFNKDKIDIWIGLLTVEIYWPRIVWCKSDKGVFAHSQISCKCPTRWNAWMLTWAFVIKIVGFGFGLSWNHCNNPNRDD